MDIVDRICAALGAKGWRIVRRDTPAPRLPACVERRYKRPPMEWIHFIRNIRSCTNPDETAWFLCEEDFDRQEADGFRWNEFELISLWAAIDAGDREWEMAIREFWDRHLPVFLLVKDGYEYYAIRMDDGAVVHGIEPEFEEPENAADSFRDFAERLCTES